MYQLVIRTVGRAITEDIQRVNDAVSLIHRMVDKLPDAGKWPQGIVIGGSHGKGTAIRCRDEADCEIIRRETLEGITSAIESDSKNSEIDDTTGRGLKLHIAMDGKVIELVSSSDFKVSASRFQLKAINKLPPCYKIAVRMTNGYFEGSTNIDLKN
jgi:hypothetical protein